MMHSGPIHAETEDEVKPEINKQKLTKIKIFKAIDENGKSQDIEMKLVNNNIEFTLEIYNGILKDKYCDILSFNQLKKNKIFAIQENIEEIFDQLEVYVSDEQVYSQKCNNSLVITIFTRIKKYPEINIELKKQILDKDEAIRILLEKIKKLETENEKIQNKFTILELENKELKKEIDSIKEYIQEQKDKQDLFKNSLIVQPEEVNTICKWIDPNKKIKAELLYRASVDGKEPEVFHSFCDYKGPIIIFIKEKNSRRFGAYSGIFWTSEDMWIQDKDAFLFSLDNKMKFKNTNTKSTVFHNSNYGPTFGEQDNCVQLALSMRNDTAFKSWINDNGHCYNFSNKDLIGTNQIGKIYLTIEDYEVYLIKE